MNDDWTEDDYVHKRKYQQRAQFEKKYPEDQRRARREFEREQAKQDKRNRRNGDV